MPIQAFVDDSGGKGVSKHFVLAALAGHSESWAVFSKEWQECLAAHPRIGSFKMRDAASCSGQFRGISATERDTKLRLLAKIIDKHARLATFTVIDLKAHDEVWTKSLIKPHRDPYFFAFHNSIAAICFSLWDKGHRDRFEIIFDDDFIFGPRAKIWYPAVKVIIEHQQPDAASILPTDPVFRSDDDFLPIQAADLFAWIVRKKHDNTEYVKFDWLFNEELMHVELSEYAQYYDRPRMESVVNESRKLLREGQFPATVEKMFKHILGK